MAYILSNTVWFPRAWIYIFQFLFFLIFQVACCCCSSACSLCCACCPSSVSSIMTRLMYLFVIIVGILLSAVFLSPAVKESLEKRPADVCISFYGYLILASYMQFGAMQLLKSFYFIILCIYIYWQSIVIIIIVIIIIKL